MKRDDVVCRASEYLECGFLLLFSVAKLYANKPHNRTQAEKALGKYQRTGRFDTDVEDFCLDILSKRVGLDTVLTKKGFTLKEKK